MTAPPFKSGLEVSELFYHDAVKPLLEAHLPGVAYAAARLGRGSDVLGFDTPRSTDHDWGPYLVIHADHVAEALQKAITSAEVRRLPPYGGAVDQYVDSTDVLDNEGRFAHLRVLYRQGEL